MPDSVFVFRGQPGRFRVVPASCVFTDPVPVLPIVPIAPVEVVAARAASGSDAQNALQDREITVQCSWAASAIEPVHSDVWPPVGPATRWPAASVAAINVTTINVPDGTPVSITVHHCETRADCAAPLGFASADVIPDPHQLLRRLVVNNNRVVATVPADEPMGDWPALEVQYVHQANVGDTSSRKSVTVECVPGASDSIVFNKPGSNIETAVSLTEGAKIEALMRPVLADRIGMYARGNRLVIKITGDNANDRRRLRLANVEAKVRSVFAAERRRFPLYRDDLMLPDGVARPAMVFGPAHDLWPIWKYPFYFFKVRVHLGQADRTARDTDLLCWSPSQYWTSDPIKAACLRLKRWHVSMHAFSVVGAGIRDTANTNATDAYKTAGWQDFIIRAADPGTNQAAANLWGLASANSYFVAQRSHGRVYINTPAVPPPGPKRRDARVVYYYKRLPEEIDSLRASRVPLSQLRMEERTPIEKEINDWVPPRFSANYKSIFYYGNVPAEMADPEPNAIGGAELATALIKAPRYLMYFNTCRGAAEPSLARAFLAKGTDYVIACERPIAGVGGDQSFSDFFNAWETATFDPAQISPLFDQHVATTARPYKPVLFGKPPVGSNEDQIRALMLVAYGGA